MFKLMDEDINKQFESNTILLSNIVLILRHVLAPRTIKLFPCSTQLNTKFIILINVKMPTIFGILTFISMINTTFESLKARKVFVI